MIMNRSKTLFLPNELTSSRVYLADFDRVTYSQVAWDEEDIERLITNYERKVKLLLLVKGHLIIPITHLLESELAREVLGPHPGLFSGGAVIPMLPQDFSSATGFLQMQLASLDEDNASLYRGSEPEEMAALLDENSLFLRWEANDASQWFQQRILADLEDSHSLINLTFQHNKLKLPKKTLRRLAKIEKLNRTDVYFAAKELKDLDRWELLSGYADFVYYLSDALAVQSEGILPQENLLDFSLSDLAKGKTRLTEYEVFTKLFVDIVKAITSTHFPADFLDALSIQDAIELHEIGLQSEFIEKYDAIQQTTKNSLTIHDPERLVLTLTELESFERDLHQQFENALQRELPAHIRERRVWDVAEIFHTIATLIIPFYGNVDTAKELLVSGLSVLGKDDVTRRVKNRVVSAVDAADRVVDRRDVYARPILLDFVSKMKQRYADYLAI
jgi:hypothetical protein